MKQDVVVVGGGLSGFTAALMCAEQGAAVTLIFAGAGTLPLSGGVIDVLGFDGQKREVQNPAAALSALPSKHPYRKMGVESLQGAIDWFKDFAARYGHPYEGELTTQIPVATAAGTIKPTCLAPRSLNGSPLVAAKRIVVVGIVGLKDFYERLVAAALPKIFADKEITAVTVDLHIGGKRDMTMLDVARRLDEPKTQEAFVNALKPYVANETAFVTGQILGMNSVTAVDTEERLGAPIRETTGLPPAVNGLRLAKIYERAIIDAKINTVRGAKVIAAKRDGRRIVSVTAKAAARENEYFADAFILATGGFYGGGIVMERFNEPYEPIFNLPVDFIAETDDDLPTDIFAGVPQKFALTGLMTDEHLRSIDGAGKLVAENLFVVGKNLSGYDYCFEHSGNGVALASAYKASHECLCLK